MPSMWKWIIINIIGQIIDISESLYFQLDPKMKCTFSSVSYIVKTESKRLIKCSAYIGLINLSYGSFRDIFLFKT